MSNVEQITENFRFHDKKHAYEYKKDGEWKPMTGVTTILNVIAKPALIPWAARMATSHIKKNGEKAEEGYIKATEALLKEAKNAHRRSKDDAADIGTVVHDAIEHAVKDAIEADRRGLDPMYDYAVNTTDLDEKDKEKVEKMLSNFNDWVINNDIKFLASEQRLFSTDMWVAGTVDLVFEKDCKKFVGDIKTGKAIYPTYFYQMAGYELMLEERGHDFDGVAVIRVGKRGDFETQYRFDTTLDKKAFKGALEIYKANKSYA